MDLRSMAHRAAEHVGIDTKTELTSSEVLQHLYEALRKEGKVQSNIEYSLKESKEHTYLDLEVTYNGKKLPLAENSWLERFRLELASSDDGVRTDVCELYADKCAIVRANNIDKVIVHGNTNYTWKHLAGVDEAVMFGAMNWAKLIDDKGFQHRYSLSLESKEDLQKISHDQVKEVMRWYGGLSSTALIGSWEKQLFIRNGFNSNDWSFKREEIPEHLVTRKASKPTKIVSYFGIPMVLEKPETEEQIRARGLAPTQHQKLFYQKEVVEYLKSYVNNQIDALAIKQEVVRESLKRIH
jgi:hypothetical protein